MELIRCENLSLRYNNKILFENLNFSIDEGDYFCIVGENGSGKTTLMKALLGMKSPSAGRIGFSDAVKKGGIGYLPQQTDAQKDFPASVYEVVISGCQNKRGFRPFYNAAEKKIAEDNLKRLGIENLKKHCYSELSGGQQQRVLIARALSATEQIMMLDEPVTGLDPGATEDMYHIVSELNKNGVTIIMISHDAPAAIKYANKILHLGDDIFFGTKEEYCEYLEGSRR